MSIFTSAIESLLRSSLAKEIETMVTAELSSNPDTSLEAVEAAVDEKSDSILAAVIARFPKWEQAFLNMVLSIGEDGINTFVNGVIAGVYEKLAPAS